MQGAANDYIYINCFETKISDPGKLAMEMSRRHFSVGSDGLVLICPSDVADAEMKMFNADGSEGRMCGNAIRCVAKFLYDNSMVKKEKITINTLSGIKVLDLFVKEGKIDTVRVDMGKASFSPEAIPTTFPGEHINMPFEASGMKVLSTAVSMGNPHNVIFSTDTDKLELEKIGPDFECSPFFPEKTNTEFASVISPCEIKMRVWERGSGETYACGTGACAVAASAVKTGLAKAETDIKIRLKGGELTINVGKDYEVFMTGPARRVFDGIYYTED